MAEVDWVSRLSECSLQAVYEKLKLQLRQDVDARNRQLSKNQDVPNEVFKFVGNGGNFSVALLGKQGRKGKAVTFILNDNHIAVNNPDDTEMFQATLTLSDDGECKFKIDGQEKEFWQFRKRALEELFFGDPWLTS